MPDTDTIEPGSVLKRFGFDANGKRIGAPVAPARSASPPATAATPGEPSPGSVLRRFGFDADGKPLAPAAKPAAPAKAKDDIEERAGRLADVSGFSGSMVEGMPIVGPLAHRASAAARAGIDVATGREASYGEAYDRELATIRRAQEIYRERNPWTSLAGNIAGAGAITAPVAGTAVGARLLGLRGDIPALGIGNTIGSRVYAGALGGGAIGAGDAALRGEDAGGGGALGAATGAAAPIVGQAAGAIARGVTNAARDVPGVLSSVNPTAREWLSGAMANETPASIAAAQRRMGPQGFVSDLNPALTELAAGQAARSEAPASQEIAEAYRARQAAARQTTEDALNRTIGPRHNIEDFRDAITQNRAAVADPLYRQWRSMQVVPTQGLQDLVPTLEHLGLTRDAQEHALMRGIPFNNPATPATAASGHPTTESWDMIKRAIDARIETAYASGNSTRAADLVTLKNRMINEIRSTPAGRVWDQARAAFADHSELLNQMEAGRDTFLGGRSGTSPDQLRNELQGLSRPELQARLVGMRAAASETMDAARNGDTTLRNKFLAPANQEKLALMIGNRRADELIRTVEQQTYLAQQAQYVNPRAGSATAGRTQAAARLEPPPSAAGPWLHNLNILKPGTYLPQSWIDQFLPGTIFQGGREAGYAAARQQLGPVLTARGPQGVQDFLSAVQAENVGRGRAAARGEGVRQATTALLAGPGSEELRRRRHIPDLAGVLSAPAR